jgi:hypothetical protein
MRRPVFIIRAVFLAGVIVLGSALVWFAVVHAQLQPNDPIAYEWRPPERLRITAWLGVLLLLGAGSATLYRSLRQRLGRPAASKD